MNTIQRASSTSLRISTSPAKPARSGAPERGACLRTAARALSCLLLAAFTPSLLAQQLDPGFGEGGRALVRFGDGASNHSADGVVACAGPNGSLLVSGLVGDRIVTARLRENGTLDSGFSDDGRQEFALPMTDTGNRERVGACQPDGNLLLALAIRGRDDDQNLLLVRVLGATGLPDPQFGTGGFVQLNLDAYSPELADRETPLGLSVSADGTIDLAGSVEHHPSGAARGFIVRVRADGSIRAARVLNDSALLGFSLTSAAESNGELWAIGSASVSGGPQTFIHYRLDPDTLAVRARLAGGSSLLRVGRGRWVAEGVFAAVAHRSESPGPDVPMLLIVRGAEVSALPLPAPAAVGGVQGELIQQEHDGDVIPLPEGGVLASYTVDTGRDGASGRGLHSVRVLLSADGLNDRVDRSFGAAGRFSLRHALPCAADAGLLHRRSTLWNGRVTWVGSALADGCPINARHDVWIARLQPLHQFRDGFE
jgi:hypothetical protein